MKRVNLLSLAILTAAIASAACTEKSKDLDGDEEGDAAEDDGGADGDARDDGDDRDDGDPIEDDGNPVEDVGDPVEDEREAPYQCWEGPCCDTDSGRFQPSTYSCGAGGGMEYRCSSADCGADGQEREFQQSCTGTSSECDGELWFAEWRISGGMDCTSSQICVTDFVSGAVCQDCPGGCTDGVCIEP
jgi:hypothetical protein